MNFSRVNFVKIGIESSFSTSVVNPVSSGNEKSERTDEKMALKPTFETLMPKNVFSHVKYEHLLAGISGGVTSTLILHPLDLIKIRFAGNYCSNQYL